MPFDIHTVEVPDGGVLAQPDRTLLGIQYGIANASGGAGASVTTAVTGFVNLPANYFVDVEPSQACFVTITGKTSTGFNVVMTPAVAGSGTISAGTFNVKVSA
jgi:hypothetical protein